MKNSVFQKLSKRGRLGKFIAVIISKSVLNYPVQSGVICVETVSSCDTFQQWFDHMKNKAIEENKVKKAQETKSKAESEMKEWHLIMKKKRENSRLLALEEGIRKEKEREIRAEEIRQREIAFARHLCENQEKWREDGFTHRGIGFLGPISSLSQPRLSRSHPRGYITPVGDSRFRHLPKNDRALHIEFEYLLHSTSVKSAKDIEISNPSRPSGVNLESLNLWKSQQIVLPKELWVSTGPEQVRMTEATVWNGKRWVRTQIEVRTAQESVSEMLGVKEIFFGGCGRKKTLFGHEYSSDNSGDGPGAAHCNPGIPSHFGHGYSSDNSGDGPSQSRPKITVATKSLFKKLSKTFEKSPKTPKEHFSHSIQPTPRSVHRKGSALPFFPDENEDPIQTFKKSLEYSAEQSHVKSFRQAVPRENESEFLRTEAVILEDMRKKQVVSSRRLKNIHSLIEQNLGHLESTATELIDHFNLRLSHVVNTMRFGKQEELDPMIEDIFGTVIPLVKKLVETIYKETPSALLVFQNLPSDAIHTLLVRLGELVSIELSLQIWPYVIEAIMSNPQFVVRLGIDSNNMEYLPVPYQFNCSPSWIINMMKSRPSRLRTLNKVDNTLRSLCRAIESPKFNEGLFLRKMGVTNEDSALAFLTKRLTPRLLTNAIVRADVSAVVVECGQVISGYAGFKDDLIVFVFEVTSDLVRWIIPFIIEFEGVFFPSASYLIPEEVKDEIDKETERVHGMISSVTRFRLDRTRMISNEAHDKEIKDRGPFNLRLRIFFGYLSVFPDLSKWQSEKTYLGISDSEDKYIKDLWAKLRNPLPGTQDIEKLYNLRDHAEDFNIRLSGLAKGTVSKEWSQSDLQGMIKDIDTLIFQEVETIRETRKHNPNSDLEGDDYDEFIRAERTVFEVSMSPLSSVAEPAITVQETDLEKELRLLKERQERENANLLNDDVVWTNTALQEESEEVYVPNTDYANFFDSDDDSDKVGEELHVPGSDYLNFLDSDSDSDKAGCKVETRKEGVSSYLDFLAETTENSEDEQGSIHSNREILEVLPTADSDLAEKPDKFSPSDYGYNGPLDFTIIDRINSLNVRERCSAFAYYASDEQRKTEEGKINGFKPVAASYISECERLGVEPNPHDERFKTVQGSRNMLRKIMEKQEDWQNTSGALGHCLIRAAHQASGIPERVILEEATEYMKLAFEELGADLLEQMGVTMDTFFNADVLLKLPCMYHYRIVFFSETTLIVKPSGKESCLFIRNLQNVHFENLRRDTADVLSLNVEELLTHCIDDTQFLTAAIIRLIEEDKTKKQDRIKGHRTSPILVQEAPCERILSSEEDIEKILFRFKSEGRALGFSRLLEVSDKRNRDDDPGEEDGLELDWSQFHCEKKNNFDILSASRDGLCLIHCLSYLVYKDSKTNMTYPNLVNELTNKCRVIIARREKKSLEEVEDSWFAITDVVQVARDSFGVDVVYGFSGEYDTTRIPNNLVIIPRYVTYERVYTDPFLVLQRGHAYLYFPREIGFNLGNLLAIEFLRYLAFTNDSVLDFQPIQSRFLFKRWNDQTHEIDLAAALETAKFERFLGSTQIGLNLTRMIEGGLGLPSQSLFPLLLEVVLNLKYALCDLRSSLSRSLDQTSEQAKGFIRTVKDEIREVLLALRWQIHNTLNANKRGKSELAIISPMMLEAILNDDLNLASEAFKLFSASLLDQPDLMAKAIERDSRGLVSTIGFYDEACGKKTSLSDIVDKIQDMKRKFPSLEIEATNWQLFVKTEEKEIHLATKTERKKAEIADQLSHSDVWKVPEWAYEVDDDAEEQFSSEDELPAEIYSRMAKGESEPDTDTDDDLDSEDGGVPDRRNEDLGDGEDSQTWLVGGFQSQFSGFKELLDDIGIIMEADSVHNGRKRKCEMQLEHGMTCCDILFLHSCLREGVQKLTEALNSYRVQELQIQESSVPQRETRGIYRKEIAAEDLASNPSDRIGHCLRIAIKSRTGFEIEDGVCTLEEIEGEILSAVLLQTFYWSLSGESHVSDTEFDDCCEATVLQQMTIEPEREYHSYYRSALPETKLDWAADSESLYQTGQTPYDVISGPSEEGVLEFPEEKEVTPEEMLEDFLEDYCFELSKFLLRLDLGSLQATFISFSKRSRLENLVDSRISAMNALCCAFMSKLSLGLDLSNNEDFVDSFREHTETLSGKYLKDLRKLIEFMGQETQDNELMDSIHRLVEEAEMQIGPGQVYVKVQFPESDRDLEWIQDGLVSKAAVLDPLTASRLMARLANRKITNKTTGPIYLLDSNIELILNKDFPNEIFLECFFVSTIVVNELRRLLRKEGFYKFVNSLSRRDFLLDTQISGETGDEAIIRTILGFPPGRINLVTNDKEMTVIAREKGITCLDLTGFLAVSLHYPSDDWKTSGTWDECFEGEPVMIGEQIVVESVLDVEFSRLLGIDETGSAALIPNLFFVEYGSLVPDSSFLKLHGEDETQTKYVPSSKTEQEEYVKSVVDAIDEFQDGFENTKEIRIEPGFVAKKVMDSVHETVAKINDSRRKRRGLEDSVVLIDTSKKEKKPDSGFPPCCNTNLSLEMILNNLYPNKSHLTFSNEVRKTEKIFGEHKNQNQVFIDNDGLFPDKFEKRTLDELRFFSEVNYEIPSYRTESRKFTIVGESDRIQAIRSSVEGDEYVEYPDLEKVSFMMTHIVELARTSRKLKGKEMILSHAGFSNMGAIIPANAPVQNMTTKVKYRVWFIVSPHTDLESFYFYPDYAQTLQDGSLFVVSRQYIHEAQKLIHKSRLYTNMMTHRLLCQGNNFTLLFWAMFFSDSAIKGLLSFFKYFNVVMHSDLSKFSNLTKKYFKGTPKRAVTWGLVQKIQHVLEKTMNEHKLETLMGTPSTLLTGLEHNNVYTLPPAQTRSTVHDYQQFYDDILSNIATRERGVHTGEFSETFTEKKHVSVAAATIAFEELKKRPNMRIEDEEYNTFARSEFNSYFVTTTNGVNPFSLRKEKNIVIYNKMLLVYYDNVSKRTGLGTKNDTEFDPFDFIDWAISQCKSRGAKALISIKAQKDVSNREIVIQDFFTKAAHFHIQIVFKYLCQQWPEELVTKSEFKKLERISRMRFSESSIFFNDDMKKWSGQDVKEKFRLVIDLCLHYRIITKCIHSLLIQSYEAIENIILLFDRRLQNPNLTYYTARSLSETGNIRKWKEHKIGETGLSFTPVFMTLGWPQGLMHFISSFTHGLCAIVTQKISKIVCTDCVSITILFHSDDKNGSLDFRKKQSPEMIRSLVKVNAMVPLSFSLAQSDTKPSVTIYGTILDPENPGRNSKKISEMVSVYNIEGTIVNSWVRQASTIFSSLSHRSYQDNAIEILSRLCSMVLLSNSIIIPEKLYGYFLNALKRFYRYPEELTDCVMNWGGDKSLALMEIIHVGLQGDNLYKFLKDPKKRYFELSNPVTPVPLSINKKFKKQIRDFIDFNKIIRESSFDRNSNLRDFIFRELRRLQSSSAGIYASERDAAYHNLFRHRNEPNLRLWADIRALETQRNENIMVDQTTVSFSIHELAAKKQSHPNPRIDELSAGSSEFLSEFEKLVVSSLFSTKRLDNSQAAGAVTRLPSSFGYSMDTTFEDALAVIEIGQTAMTDIRFSSSWNTIVRDIKNFTDSYRIRFKEQFRTSKVLWDNLKKSSAKRNPIALLWKGVNHFSDLEFVPLSYKEIGELGKAVEGKLAMTRNLPRLFQRLKPAIRMGAALQLMVDFLACELNRIAWFSIDLDEGHDSIKLILNKVDVTLRPEIARRLPSMWMKYFCYYVLRIEVPLYDGFIEVDDPDSPEESFSVLQAYIERGIVVGIVRTISGNVTFSAGFTDPQIEEFLSTKFRGYTLLKPDDEFNRLSTRAKVPEGIISGVSWNKNKRGNVTGALIFTMMDHEGEKSEISRNALINLESGPRNKEKKFFGEIFFQVNELVSTMTVVGPILKIKPGETDFEESDLPDELLPNLIRDSALAIDWINRVGLSVCDRINCPKCVAFNKTYSRDICASTLTSKPQDVSMSTAFGPLKDRILSRSQYEITVRALKAERNKEKNERTGFTFSRGGEYPLCYALINSLIDIYDEDRTDSLTAMNSFLEVPSMYTIARINHFMKNENWIIVYDKKSKCLIAVFGSSFFRSVQDRTQPLLVMIPLVPQSLRVDYIGFRVSKEHRDKIAEGIRSKDPDYQLCVFGDLLRDSTRLYLEMDSAFVNGGDMLEAEHAIDRALRYHSVSGEDKAKLFAMRDKINVLRRQAEKRASRHNKKLEASAGQKPIDIYDESFMSNYQEYIKGVNEFREDLNQILESYGVKPDITSYDYSRGVDLGINILASKTKMLVLDEVSDFVVCIVMHGTSASKARYHPEFIPSLKLDTDYVPDLGLRADEDCTLEGAMMYSRFFETFGMTDKMTLEDEIELNRTNNNIDYETLEREVVDFKSGPQQKLIEEYFTELGYDLGDQNEIKKEVNLRMKKDGMSLVLPEVKKIRSSDSPVRDESDKNFDKGEKQILTNLVSDEAHYAVISLEKEIMDYLSGSPLSNRHTGILWVLKESLQCLDKDSLKLFLGFLIEAREFVKRKFKFIFVTLPKNPGRPQVTSIRSFKNEKRQMLRILCSPLEIDVINTDSIVALIMINTFISHSYKKTESKRKKVSLLALYNSVSAALRGCSEISVRVEKKTPKGVDESVTADFDSFIEFLEPFRCSLPICGWTTKNNSLREVFKLSVESSQAHYKRLSS